MVPDDDGVLREDLGTVWLSGQLRRWRLAGCPRGCGVGVLAARDGRDGDALSGFFSLDDDSAYDVRLFKMTAQRRRSARQLRLGLRTRTWGGARKGAGRKAAGPRRVGHRERPALAARHPLHVTLRLEKGLPSVRQKRLFKVIKRAVRDGNHRFGFRVVHYSVQSNHLHLVTEAKDKDALSRGMKGLQVRIARGLNALLSRRGRVFSDRYHARALKTPREVRNALAYVLLNARRHAAQAGRRFAPSWLDPFSSGACFDGWKSGCPALSSDEVDVAAPHTWLLAKGWRRRGLLDLAEVPGAF